MALVAYALKLTQAPIAEQAFGILADHARTIGEYMYWGNIEVPQPPSKLENQKYFSLPRLPYEYDSINIETTAYALLTYVSRHEIMVDAIVRWLTSQRLNDGGWASTSDTSAAMKALIEYTMHTRIRDVSKLEITVEATSLPGEKKILYITDQNIAKLQTIEVRVKLVRNVQVTDFNEFLVNFSDSKCLGYSKNTSQRCWLRHSSDACSIQR